MNVNQKKIYQDEAFKYTNLGAIAQHPVALHNLASIYQESGNIVEALRWYRISAEKNNRYSQLKLSQLLRNIHASTVDSPQRRRELTEAMVWLEVSAQNNEKAACLDLGIHYLQESQEITDPKTQEKRLMEAVVCLKRATEISPFLQPHEHIYNSLEEENLVITQAYYNLGITYAFLSNTTEFAPTRLRWIDAAIRSLEIAVERGAEIARPVLAQFRGIKQDIIDGKSTGVTLGAEPLK